MRLGCCGLLGSWGSLVHILTIVTTGWHHSTPYKRGRAGIGKRQSGRSQLCLTGVSAGKEEQRTTFEALKELLAYPDFLSHRETTGRKNW